MQLKTKFYKQFKNSNETVEISVPGRVEIGGNHTDHNGGCVLASGIDRCTYAVAAKNDENIIRIYSEGFGICECDAKNPQKTEGFGAFVGGVCQYFIDNGRKTGGFDAYVTSDIPAGAGLSSSASYGVLVARLMDKFYGKGRIKAVDAALAAQYAEREFYGKPCGLLDQLVCAEEKLVFIDFAGKPKVKRIDANFENYDFLLVNTHSSHEGLDAEYASIPNDMFAVARILGKDKLCKISRKKIIGAAGEIREKLGDRALLRALHFEKESNRAVLQKEALERGDVKEFLRLVRESGHSSYEYLQNIYVPTNPTVQPIALALNIAQDIIGDEGAYRIHGGGFAGTILVISPWHLTEKFIKEIEKVFGKNCVMQIKLR